MGLKNFIGSKHSSVPRDYRSRVTDAIYPKHVAAELAKKWGKEYWDGDRRTGYGGYDYIPGYWTPLAKTLIAEYGLMPGSKVLDIGCGKGFLLAELKTLIPELEISGIDISTYAVDQAHGSIKGRVLVGSCTTLPFEDLEFDLAVSLNVFHNLEAPDLEAALREIVRVSNKSYIVMESYASEKQKENLLFWQLTCEAFLTPDEWAWWFRLCNYDRDFEFIFFD
jgi:protein-L-isoaspartate(D-aspartate) O-methyltransferase